MKTYTLKQLLTIRAGTYGKLTEMVHRLCETAMVESAASLEHADSLRRVQERLREYTSLRPEHERVLMLLTGTPIGLPAVEVFHDARVKLKVVEYGDQLPLVWDAMLYDPSVRQADTIVLPKWTKKPVEII